MPQINMIKTNKSAIVAALFCLISWATIAQSETSTDFAPEETKFHGEKPNKMFHSKSISKSLGATPAGTSTYYMFTGFNPEIRFNKGTHVGASYTLMSLTGGFGIAAYGVSLGVNGDVRNSVYECKASMYFAAVLLAVGVDLKLNFTRKFYERDQRINSIRPELGLALGPIFFNYGYDIFLGKKPDVLGRNNFSITTYIPLFKIKEESFGPLEYAY